MATLATFFRRVDGGRRRSCRIRFVRSPILSGCAVFRTTTSTSIRSASTIQPTASARPIPRPTGQCWSAVSAAAVLLMIAGSIIAPNVASVLAGYKPRL